MSNHYLSLDKPDRLEQRVEGLPSLETPMNVAGWLRTLKLQRYEAAFNENDVTPDILFRLTAEDLIDLGVRSVGPRRLLLDAIAALRENSDLVGTTGTPPAETDALGHLHELVPGALTRIEDRFIGVPNTVAEKIGTQILPDVLHWVQFG